MRWFILSALLGLSACQTTGRIPPSVLQMEASKDAQRVDDESVFFFPGNPTAIYNAKKGGAYMELAVYDDYILYVAHTLSLYYGPQNSPTAEDLSKALELSRILDHQSPVYIGEAFQDKIELTHEVGHTYGRFWYEGGACLIAHRAFGTRLNPNQSSKASIGFQCFDDGRLPTNRVDTLIGRLRSVDIK